MSNESGTNQAVMAKIAKLLARTDVKRGVTEAEAATAAGMVQAMLQEHGLSLAEVEAAGGSVDDGGRDKRVADRRAVYGWQRKLMRTIAETNFCMHRVRHVVGKERGQNSRHHLLVGRKINVDATLAVYDYLSEAMLRLCAEAGIRHGGSDFHAWREGCVDRLTDRLEERAEEARKASEEKAKAARGNGTHRELMLADVYGTESDLNNDHLCGFAPGTTAVRRAADQRRQDEADKKWADLQEQGVEKWEAWYIAHGYGEEDAKRCSANFRRSSGRRSSGRGYRGGGWTSADTRRGSDAYRAGQEAGGKIGLDPQATHRKPKLIGEG
jgi:hypothetical protein